MVFDGSTLSVHEYCGVMGVICLGETGAVWGVGGSEPRGAILLLFSTNAGERFVCVSVGAAFAAAGGIEVSVV